MSEPLSQILLLGVIKIKLTTFSSDRTCSARCFLKSSILKFSGSSTNVTVRFMEQSENGKSVSQDYKEFGRGSWVLK